MKKLAYKDNKAIVIVAWWMIVSGVYTSALRALGYLAVDGEPSWFQIVALGKSVVIAACGAGLIYRVKESVYAYVLAILAFYISAWLVYEELNYGLGFFIPFAVMIFLIKSSGRLDYIGSLRKEHNKSKLTESQNTASGFEAFTNKGE